MSQDLSQMLQSFLGSEDGQEKLKSVADMLGGNSENGPDLSNIDLSQLSNMFGGGSSENQDDTDNEEQQESSSQPDFGGLDLNMLLKVQNMMGKMKTDDKNTNLILALKPHLKPERQKKADDALKIMRLISILPLLKESGLFGQDGGLLSNLLG